MSSLEAAAQSELPFRFSVVQVCQRFLIRQNLRSDSWEMNARKVTYYYDEIYAGHEEDRTDTAVLDSMRRNYHHGGLEELASLAAVNAQLIGEVGDDEIRYRLFAIAEDNISALRVKHAREDIGGRPSPMRDKEITQIQTWTKLQEDILRR